MFTLDIHPPIFLIIYSSLCLIFYLLVFKKNNYSSRELKLRFIYIFYWLALVKLTIFPININISKKDIGIEPYLYYQLIPFRTIIKSFESGGFPIQIFITIVLFLLLVLFLAFLKRGKITFRSILMVTCLTSISIEMFQLFINMVTKLPNNIANIDDLILSLLGSIFGWGIFKALYKYKPELFNL